MLSAIGSPLVAGSVAQSIPMARKIEVTRPLYLNREVQKVGSILEVSQSLAHDLVTSQKAKYVEAQAAPASSASVTTSTSKKESAK